MRSLALSGRCWVALGVVACATPQPSPVVSPTGFVYELGTPPVETRNSQTATLYLRQDRVDRALDIALEGVTADSTNPIHYFLAGVAAARLGQYRTADAMFDDAQRIYPAYELDIEPEREAAWGAAFNSGLEAYEAGDVERTIAAWTDAALLYDLRPEAHRNLAGLLAVEGRYAEAIDAYRRGLTGLTKRPPTRVIAPGELEERRVATAELEESLAQLLLLTDRYAEAEPLLRRQLDRTPDATQVRADLAAALSGQGRDDEAREIYGDLLSREGLAATQVFSLGVGLFRASDFPQAARAFRRLTELQPGSRDAWFNYVNALFAAEDWQELAVAGDRLVELDPLGESSFLITARAKLETGDREAALAAVARAEEAPVYVDELQMQGSGGATSIVGRVSGNTAQPGTPIRLRFIFYDDTGRSAGTEAVTLEAPRPEESTSFVVTHAQRAAAYRYELLP